MNEECGAAKRIGHEQPEGDEVRIYATSRRIGENYYGEQICARSLKEAQQVAALFGAEVLGTLEEALCARCLAPIAGAAEPKVERNDWPEEIDG